MMNNAFDVFQGKGDASYLNWQAQRGTWSVNGEDADIKRLLLAPETLRTGWGRIMSGMPADFVWADVAGTSTSRPSEDHKQAFEIAVYVSQKHGAPVDGWVDWRTTQRGSRDGLSRIWQTVHEQAPDHPGEAVVIEFTGGEPIKIGPGQTIIPQFKVIGWTASPDGRVPSEGGTLASAAKTKAPAGEDDELF